MLYLTCTTITSVDLAHYEVSRAKDWVFVDCGTITVIGEFIRFLRFNIKIKGRGLPYLQKVITC